MANEGNARDLLPRGNALRQAVRWISEQRQLRPNEKLVKLIDEASLRFDLTPNDATFLHRTLVEES